MNLKEYIRKSAIRPEAGDRIEYMDIGCKMISTALVNSQRNVPGVCCTYEADVTKLVEVFEKFRSECDYRLTFNSLMLKILVEGLKVAPKLNAHFLYNHRATSGKLIIKKHIDVSMAINLEDGKTSQVKIMNLEDKTLQETAFLAEDIQRRIRNTDLNDTMYEVSRQRVVGDLLQGKFLSSLCQTAGACFGKGRAIHLTESLKSDFLKLIGKKSFTSPDGLKLEELNEGTVCFSNWGPLYDNLDVNITFIPPLYPQVFLFATGRIKDKEYVYKDESGNLQLGTKKVLPMSMNFDHKIGGAADLIPFVKKLDEIFENPEIILTW